MKEISTKTNDQIKQEVLKKAGRQSAAKDIVSFSFGSIWYSLLYFANTIFSKLLSPAKTSFNEEEEN